MVWGGIAQGVKSQLIVVEDNMIAVRLLRDEILRSVAVLLVHGGGRVVRWCWVNFQCRGVLQFGLQ